MPGILSLSLNLHLTLHLTSPTRHPTTCSRHLLENSTSCFDSEESSFHTTICKVVSPPRHLPQTNPLSCPSRTVRSFLAMSCLYFPPPLGGCMPRSSPRRLLPQQRPADGAAKRTTTWSSHRNIPRPISTLYYLPDSDDHRSAGTEAYLKMFPYHAQPSYQYTWRHPAGVYLDAETCLAWGVQRRAFTPETTAALRALLRDCRKFRTNVRSPDLENGSWSVYTLMMAARRVITKARREQTYWRVLDQLSRLEWDNLRARYLPLSMCDSDRAMSQWSSLMPYVCTILGEVTRERWQFETWRDAVGEGHHLTDEALLQAPSRRWNRMLLKVAKYSYQVRMYAGRALPWPFARIMRVLEDTHSRIHEYQRVGTFLSAPLLHRVHPVEAALIVARDIYLAGRVPPRHEPQEVQAIRKRALAHASRLLYRVVLSEAGVPIALFFRGDDGKPEAFAPNSAQCRAVITAKEWPAVPLARIIDGELIDLQQVRVESRFGSKTYMLCFAGEDMETRYVIDAVWKDNILRFRLQHGNFPWETNPLAELMGNHATGHGMLNANDANQDDHGNDDDHQNYHHNQVSWEAETQSSGYMSARWDGYVGCHHEVGDLPYDDEIEPKLENKQAQPVPRPPMCLPRRVNEAVHAWLEHVEKMGPDGAGTGWIAGQRPPAGEALEESEDDESEEDRWWRWQCEGAGGKWEEEDEDEDEEEDEQEEEDASGEDVDGYYGYSGGEDWTESDEDLEGSWALAGDHDEEGNDADDEEEEEEEGHGVGGPLVII
ncbi:hypothetical protein JDV02_009893 [Purpureocillium takamizusanense]|uniref:Uncharacterized protein n=1 Tax=Purpureocillium takamizusanense TaxID=2060973 RepID=A0A9Q8QPQ5_9HYPO|nr:uncharacterized protein JDV02_009893 [Purpureocillium takamizusanense]UNI24118.1 hypothetical protein JDV02_009893 [Purpureocillium takamizusanense]